jgi:hypothetical protein
MHRYQLHGFGYERQGKAPFSAGPWVRRPSPSDRRRASDLRARPSVAATTGLRVR